MDLIRCFPKNRDIEDRRNADRFDFINWTKKAFDNVDVIPPGNGIMHQINLEKKCLQLFTILMVLHLLIHLLELIHTPHVDALGVIAVGLVDLKLKM